MESKKLSVKVGERIVKLRNDLGLRQIDLANKAEIDDAFLRRIETGRVNPTLKTLEKLAIALEVKIKELFEFE